MNTFLSIFKIAAAVLTFLSNEKDAVARLVNEAEVVFADAKQGPAKLAYVISGIYGLAEDAGAELAKFPADLVLPFLSGRIGQIVAKLFPKPSTAAVKAATA